MHAGELAVDAALVAALVRAQFPGWAALPVRMQPTAGTVNAIARLGDALAARLPLLADDPAAARARLADEADAARRIAAVCPVPTPRPVAVGAPGPGYPMPWSVQTWLPGDVATYDEPGGSLAFARDLAGVLAALRAADTGGRTFSGRGRGGALRSHDEWLARCLRESEGLLDVPLLRSLWARLRAAPRTDPDAMAHGDLVAGNVLVAGDRLAGLLDVGGYGPADPALDLAAAWHLLDDGPRDELRARLAPPAEQWERGAAWAFVQAMGAVWYYRRSHRAMSAGALRTLQRVVHDTVGPGAEPAPPGSPAWDLLAGGSYGPAGGSGAGPSGPSGPPAL